MLPQLGLVEMLMVMGVAVLLFGKRLPEVGRSLGRGLIEFKKGLTDVSQEMDYGSSSSSSSYSSGYGYGTSRRYDEKPRGDSVYDETSVPKFEVPGAASTSSSTGSQWEYPGPTSQD
jgi:sec-independent protein translocase protein TatA